MATINGTNANNNLNGTNLADQIFGFAGNDILIGFDGDDVLEGGAGADELFGSPGFDIASYRSSVAGVVVLLNDLSSSGGDAEGDAFYSIEGVRGSAYRDLLVGDDQRNIIHGEGGADQLGGLDGNDILDGGNGNDLLEGGFGNDELRGGAGTDTASLYNYGSGVTADLASGTATGTVTGNDRLIGIENLIGTPFADRLAGNSGANVLDGSFGADVLIGRGGADRFDYDQTDYSDPKAPDRILDFSRAEKDKIDFRDIDANEQMNGNQTFTFIGQGPFTGAGQVRYYHQNGDTIIEADTNTTISGAEPVIVLDGLISLRAGDFIL